MKSFAIRVLKNLPVRQAAPYIRYQVGYGSPHRNLLLKDKKTSTV
jgi:hypothetical protein